MAEIRPVETRLVVWCRQRSVSWYAGMEAATCADGGHEHGQREVHRHRDAVRLLDGTQVTAASFDPMEPYARDRQPDHGLYFDSRWDPPWSHDHLDWPDFGVPQEQEILRALRALHDRARHGQNVEIGCIGGHGRTGTAVACLAVLAGQENAESVGWVRASYCPQAVETTAQEAFVRSFRS